MKTMYMCCFVRRLNDFVVTSILRE
jgi:hypothetical protein